MKKKKIRMEKELKGIVTAASIFPVAAILVLIAFSSLASASAVGRTYDGVGGVMTYEGELTRSANHEPRSIPVYEGEEIRFKNAAGDYVDVIITGAYEGDADKRSGCMDYPVKANKSWDSSGMRTGYFFKVVEKVTEDPEIGCWFSLEKQSFSLKLEKDKVQEKESFDLSLKTNNKEQGMMELTIEDRDGYSIMNDIGQDIYKVLVHYKGREFDSDPADAEGKPVYGIVHDAGGKLVFNTSLLNMNAGKYSIILKDHATGEKEDVDIEVEKIYLEVACDEVVLKGKDIEIEIESSFYEEEVDVKVGTFYNKSLTFDEEGKKKVTIPTEEIDYGRYKVTVAVCGLRDTKYVVIKKCKSSIEVPKIAIVGNIVPIEGISESGDLAVFVIDDVFKGEVPISDDEFKWYWDTSGELEGGKEIKVFTISKHVPFTIGENVSDDWKRKAGVDASASLFLFPPRLGMTVPKRIADSDDVVINGIATGTDHVYIIIINYKGEVLFPVSENASVVTVARTPVEGGEWTENIGELDIGDYAVIALSEGRDGRTNVIENGKWVIGGENKTLEERVLILMDGSAGSDDLFMLFSFTVEPAYVCFNLIENVRVGEPLEITGKTNRESGTEIAIWVIEGSTILSAVLTEVELLTVDHGVFTATIETTGAVPGIYALKAGDGEGNTDTATVEIVAPPPPAPEVSVSTDRNEYSPGDVINTTICLSNPTDEAQNMLFKLYFVIPTRNDWTEIEQKTINLLAYSDQSSTISMPVADWGNESFCGCHVASLTDTRTKKVVSVDTTAWIYLPGTESEAKHQ
ncbi:Cell surface glycoprotein [ANME-1 cluster archaeon GoMg3.2]|nr:Cell surface glycoprotein [ANME-1 cluster archaeon GoMg3.2]